MAEDEGGSDSGAVLTIIGVVLWFFAAMVFFYSPAGLKLGNHAAFVAIVGVLFVAGLVLIIAGARRRGA